MDKHQDSFVVHVNDHTRTIFLDNDTDLIQGDAQENFPLQPGDRVTVSGVLHSDGTVRADTIILGRSGNGDRRDVAGSQELVGRIIAQGRRDFTVRVSSSDRDVKVLVTRDVPITRDGEAVSLDDLTTDDDVRVSGTPDGDDFRADHITVVHDGEWGRLMGFGDCAGPATARLFFCTHVSKNNYVKLSRLHGTVQCVTRNTPVKFPAKK